MPQLSRRLTAAACAVALLVPAAPAAGADAPPTELWEEYPLREERGAPGPGGAQSPAPAPSPSSSPSAQEDEGSGPPVAALAGGAALVAAMGAGAALAARRRRSATARLAPARAAAPPPARVPERAFAFGYLRATSEDALLDEAARVREVAARRGLTLRHVVWDRPDEPTRPWLSWVVGRIAAGEASGVVLARLDDLGATPAERETVLDRLSALGATVVAADDEHDTSTEELTRRPAATGARREIAT